MIFLVTYALGLGTAAYLWVASVWGFARFGQWIGVAGLALALGLIGLSLTQPQVIFDHKAYLGDLWTALETANKSAQGLASSRDYFSPIGPVYDWVFRLTAQISPVQATSVPKANALFAGITALLAIVILTRQLSFASLGLLVLIAVSTIVSPREPDTTFFNSSMSWLAPYNRWADGLLAVVALALILPAHKRNLLASALIGLTIALLLLLKVTYGAALLGLLGIAVVLGQVRILQAVGIVAGFVLSLIVVQLSTGQLLPYLQDLQQISQLDNNGLRPIALVQQAGEMILWVAGAGLLYLLVCGLSETKPSGRLALLIGVTGVMGCMILMQNHWKSESSVYVVLLILVAETGRLFAPDSTSSSALSHSQRLSHASCAVLFVALTLIYPLRDAGAVLTQSVQSQRIAPDTAFAGTGLQDLNLTAAADSPPIAERARVLEGIAALRTVGADAPEAGAILALNFSNPFPAALGTASPTGSPIWLHAKRSFDQRVHIPPTQLFAGVDYVLRAKDEPNAALLWEIYGPYVQSRFEQTQELERWTLYTRTAQ